MRKCLLFLVFITLSLSATSQEVEAELPNAYREFVLGMNMDTVKELLSSDTWFNYRGEPPVTLLESPEGSLIETEGSLFISRGLFQFKENILVAIILELNPQNLDWYTVYTSLERKYGSPSTLNPEKAWWEDSRVRIALERPFTVKYLNMNTFNQMEAVNADRAAWREKARNDFLDEF